jgi:hypothetical protein
VKIEEYVTSKSNNLKFSKQNQCESNILYKEVKNCLITNDDDDDDDDDEARANHNRHYNNYKLKQDKYNLYRIIITHTKTQLFGWYNPSKNRLLHFITFKF